MKNLYMISWQPVYKKQDERHVSGSKSRQVTGQRFLGAEVETGKQKISSQKPVSDPVFVDRLPRPDDI